MKMHDGHDRDGIRLDPEQDAKGEGLGETASDIPFNKRVERGIIAILSRVS